MPPISFTAEVRIDGESYRARRLDGSRSYAVNYVPTVRGQQAAVQLDPLNEVDWGDGRGWGQNVDCSEGMMMPGPLVSSAALPSAPGADLEQFAEQDGHIYAVGGRYAYKIANGSGAVTADQDLGIAFIAVSVVPFKNTLIVGGRATGNIWQLTSLGAWSNTMAGAAVQRGKLGSVFWNVGGSAAYRLVGEQTASAISYVAANPLLATDWTPQPTPLTIGSYPIRSVVSSGSHAYLATTGGLFDFDNTTAINLTPEVEHVVLDSNGRATLAADGWVYMNAGYTLKRVRAVGLEYASVQDCGWASQIPPQCPMSGYCTALVKHGRWLFASIYDGTNTWVCKAREAGSGDRAGPLVWFVAPIYLAGVKVTAMHISGLVTDNPRLWMACTTGSTRSLNWAPVPLDSAYRDLRQARPYRFATAFQYDSPDEDHGDDSLPKFLREFVGESETLGTGPQLTLSVATDGSAGFTPVGRYPANPRATVRPPQTILANRYVLRHVGTGTATTPPILRKQSRRVIPRPDLLQVRPYQIVIGQDVRFSDGAVDGRSRKQAQRTLERLQRIGPISFRDENGADLSVLMVASLSLTEAEATLGDSEARRVLVADLQIAVLATVGTAWKWNDGTKYGQSGKVWV